MRPTDTAPLTEKDAALAPEPPRDEIAAWHVIDEPGPSTA
jgi:hypothetical protein